MEAVVLGDGGKDHIETVRLLVSSGADRNIPDNRGITPLEHALAREFKEIAALLDGPDKQ
jgi:ankyrin repeat protein